jgi:hypothetical protein
MPSYIRINVIVLYLILNDSCVLFHNANYDFQGTADRLMLQLIEENSVIDPTYVEDFLLTHRTFINSSVQVANQLLQW